MTPQNPARHVVVDLETTGTELHHHVTEVAWYDLDTDTYGVFVPPHRLDRASPIALDISGYHQRLAHQPIADPDTIADFHARCGGDGVRTTIICANKSFEPRYLMGLFDRSGLPSSPFTYRSFDIEDAAYWLMPDRFPRGALPGLKDIAATLGLDNSGHHRALRDVFVTVHAWRILELIRDTVTTDAHNIIGSAAAAALAPRR